MNRHIISVFLLSVVSFSVHAEPTVTTGAAEVQPAEVTGASRLGPSPFVGYAPMTPVNLMNLYWKSGIFKPGNDQTITEYIQAAACDQYQKKFKDDFAWPEMIKTTRSYITNHSQKFATMFSVIQPVALGRYIPDEKIFQITDDTGFRNVRRMIFADFQQTSGFCPRTPPPRSAPMQAAVALGAGFSLTQIPMEPGFARQVIDFIDNRMKRTEVVNEKRDRFAYVKFFYTIRKFSETTDGIGTEVLFKGPYTLFVGRLDGYEMYADQQEKFLIYRWVNPRKAQ